MEAIFKDSELCMATIDSAATLLTKSRTCDRETCAEIAEKIERDASPENEEKFVPNEDRKEDTSELKSVEGGEGDCVCRSGSSGDTLAYVREVFHISENIRIRFHL